jgi:hypothetical protein
VADEGESKVKEALVEKIADAVGPWLDRCFTSDERAELSDAIRSALSAAEGEAVDETVLADIVREALDTEDYVNFPGDFASYCVRRYVGLLLAAPPAAPAVPAQGQEAVAWYRFADDDGFIRDEAGYAIGTDEPDICWGARPKSIGWHPLYGHPFPETYFDPSTSEVPPVGHPLQKLGKHLSHLLDEDQWATAEQHLLAAWAVSAHPAPQPAIPEGMALVPVEPTQEMLEACTKTKPGTPGADALRAGVMRLAAQDYRAMLAAAPVVKDCGAGVPDARGFSMYLTREQWGAITDGLILEHDRTSERMKANSESTGSDRLDMCDDLLCRIGKAAHAPFAKAAAPSAPAASGWQQGVEAVAKMLDKKADDYAMEFGHDDMGGLSFGSGDHAQVKLEYHSSLIELAEEVRAMLSAAPVVRDCLTTAAPSVPAANGIPAESCRRCHGDGVESIHAEYNTRNICGRCNGTGDEPAAPADVAKKEGA